MLSRQAYNGTFMAFMVILTSCSGVEKEEAAEPQYILSDFEIERKDPEWTFSDNKLLIEYEVMDEDFVSADKDSTLLLELSDDTGKDLIAAHLKATNHYGAETDSLIRAGIGRFNNHEDFLIRPERWRKFGDEPLFKVEILSNLVIPSDSAEKVNVKLSINYRVQDNSGNMDTFRVTIPSLIENPSFRYKGKYIDIGDNVGTSKDGVHYNYFFISNDQLNVKISRINVYDQAGQSIRSTEVGENEVEGFVLKEGLGLDPVTIEIIYAPTVSRTVVIENTIDIPEEYLAENSN